MLTDRKFVLEGVKPALQRKQREIPPTLPKMDGKQEAHLIAICCSDPPQGRARWTIKLLMKELISRKIVISIGKETVRKKLNQGDFSTSVKFINNSLIPVKVYRVTVNLRSIQIVPSH
jgi:hypothetical protein